jgi:hypothetical protein
MKITVTESAEKVFNLTLDDIKKADGVYQSKWKDETFQERGYVLVIHGLPYAVESLEMSGFIDDCIFDNKSYRFKKLENAQVTLQF